ASRAVNTVATLHDDKQRTELDRANRAEQELLRKIHARGPIRPLATYAEANANAPAIEYAALPPPPFIGRRVVDDVTLEQLVEYVDWTFLFTAWELKGRFPQILEHPTYGPPARELYD